MNLKKDDDEEEKWRMQEYGKEIRGIRSDVEELVREKSKEKNIHLFDAKANTLLSGDY